MKYHKFYFKNFKGIVDQQITLSHSGKPLSLVGLNESGKTTILEGINLIGEHIRHYDITENQHLSNGQLQEIIPRRREGFSGKITLGCVIKDKKNAHVAELIFIYEINDSTYKNFSLTIKKNDDPLHEDGERQEWFSELKKLLPPIWLYSDFLNNVPNAFRFITTLHKEAVLQEQEEDDINKNPTYRKYVGTEHNLRWQEALNDLYISSHADTEKKYAADIFQKKVVDYLDNNQEGVMAYNAKLNNMSALLSEKIVKSWCKISNKDLIDEIKIQEFTGGELKTNGYKSYSVNIIEKDGTPYEVDERSLGFRWYFYFVLFTEIRKIRNKDALFLLDEPASNLHSSSQEQILKAINALSKGSVVMYSTHSPYLLDLSNFDSVYIVTNTKNKKTSQIKCLPLSEYSDTHNNKDGEYLRPIIHHLCFKLPQILDEYLSQMNKDEDSDAKKNFPKFLEKKFKINSAVVLKILEYIKAAYHSYEVTGVISKLLH